MGFYIRKSIKAGPFRFNLSKSGIGVSTGIKGLRVGTGPRGNYVHMGYGGLYYRKTLSNKSPTKQNPALDENTPQQQNFSMSPEYTNFQEIESSDIGLMTDSSSVELLAEFDKKRRMWRLWPFIAGLFVVSIFVVPNIFPMWLSYLTFGIEAAALYVAYNYDQIRKNVVLFYDMEPQFEKAYEDLHTSFQSLIKVNKVWHVASKADVLDRKRNAGASQVVSKTPINIKIEGAPYVKTNISVPSIPVGKQTLFFFPDRLLIFENNRVGAVSYRDLTFRVEPTRFIEDGSVPKDSQIVDHTWRYVNKSGGPDKRFSDNRQLPICLYEDMHMNSPNGLNERVQFSKCGEARLFEQAVISLSGLLANEKKHLEVNKVA